MYILNKTTARQHRYIDVVIVFDVYSMDEDIAAARAQHPENLPEEKRWTDTQLAFYNDFLDSAADAIEEYFVISSEGQSDDSYSYYMDFHANIDDWTVRYRISDHFRRRAKNKTVSSKNDRVHRLFRQIIIGPDKEFTSYPNAVKAIGEICKGISEGNLDVISKSYENTEKE